uniref:BZIP domain-containing protein n=1 Tax=Peronospora matthiolae TaxID=2874970 RepID=A0AAV1V8K0_9STRA
MASMSLNFILCDPEDALAVNSREQVKATKEGESSAFVSSIDSNCSPKSGSLAPRQAVDDQKSRGNARKLDRQQHTRQLQNLRQRRYRERKKLSASTLQSNSEHVYQENAALETSILERFKARTSV